MSGTQDGKQEVSLETLAERLKGVERILEALAHHTLTLSQRHTRIVASLGLINTAPGLLIGLKEISAFMGLSPSSILRLCKTMDFPTYRLGRHTLSHALDILAWLRTLADRREEWARTHGRQRTRSCGPGGLAHTPSCRAHAKGDSEAGRLWLGILFKVGVDELVHHKHHERRGGPTPVDHLIRCLC